MANSSNYGIAGLNKKVASMEAEYDAQIDAMAKQIAILMQQIKTQPTNTNYVTKKDFTAYKTSIDSSISVIAKQLEILQNQINELSPEIQEVIERFPDDLISTMGDDINYLKAQVTDLRDEIDQLEAGDGLYWEMAIGSYNGVSKTYKTTYEYKTGSLKAYFNGQKLILDDDYEESGVKKFKMLYVAPNSDDKLEIAYVKESS